MRNTWGRRRSTSGIYDGTAKTKPLNTRPLGTRMAATLLARTGGLAHIVYGCPSTATARTRARLDLSYNCLFACFSTTCLWTNEPSFGLATPPVDNSSTVFPPGAQCERFKKLGCSSASRSSWLFWGVLDSRQSLPSGAVLLVVDAFLINIIIETKKISNDRYT